MRTRLSQVFIDLHGFPGTKTSAYEVTPESCLFKKGRSPGISA